MLIFALFNFTVGNGWAIFETVQARLTGSLHGITREEPTILSSSILFVGLLLSRIDLGFGFGR